MLPARPRAGHHHWCESSREAATREEGELPGSVELPGDAEDLAYLPVVSFLFLCLFYLTKGWGLGTPLLFPPAPAWEATRWHSRQSQAPLPPESLSSQFSLITSWTLRLLSLPHPVHSSHHPPAPGGVFLKRTPHHGIAVLQTLLRLPSLTCRLRCPNPPRALALPA